MLGLRYIPPSDRRRRGVKMAHRKDTKLVCVSRQYGTILPALEEAINRCSERNCHGGLLQVRIDNLPMIISSQGGEFAEEMMDDLTRQIAKLIKDNDASVRTDRDHIHVLLNGYSPAEVESKAMEIFKSIQNYGCLTSVAPIQLASTIGGVTFPDTAKSVSDALNQAYVALNDAKEMFLHYVAYGNTKKHKVESRNQMILANYIQNAFLNDKLRLAFQPIINSETGNTEYYECLLRVINTDGTLSSAGPFIPIAEKMGFIEMIDGMVLQMAVRELIEYPSVSLAVNVSNATIHSSGWLAMAINLLEDPQVASRLIIEITETSELHDMKKVSYFVTALQALGCQVALDDFGSGYTSFNQLKTLPVDIIKIDGAFVRNIVDNEDSRFFVKTLIAFGRNFGLKAVAEFVENQEIADILREMGVDYMQGNYFSPAMEQRLWLEDE